MSKVIKVLGCLFARPTLVNIFVPYALKEMLEHESPL